MTKKVIFFGNGPLAEYALAIIKRECQVIFHARRREDLDDVYQLKRENPDAYGVLASFGVMIPESMLNLFEPEGIINIHPSLLPAYRGPSPIESAILAGDDEFSVSAMKLVPAMDAGPIYAQATLSDLPLDKDTIYRELATVGAQMVLTVINADQFRDEKIDNSGIEKNHALRFKRIKNPEPQDESKATYTTKLTKTMGVLHPETDTAEQILRKIVAFAGFPKAKYAFWGITCTILEAHSLKQGETAPLMIPCADGRSVAVDRLQPEGRKAMDAKSFINGYKK